MLVSPSPFSPIPHLQPLWVGEGTALAYLDGFSGTTMEKQARYVVVYDIPDDRRRNRVAKWLQGHGQRVQYSVFECSLDEGQFRRLWQGLGKRIRAEEDSVRAYRLCPACAARVMTLGLSGPVVEVPEVYVV